jgi:hypothetical protein
MIDKKKTGLRAAALLAPVALAVSVTMPAAQAAPAAQPGASVSPLTSYVLSIDYVNANYGGSSFIWYGGATCASTSYAQPTMPSGWNDVVSSFRTYSGCLVDHFENTYYGGSSTGYWSSHSYIGDAMNDRTSSEKWRS